MTFSRGSKARSWVRVGSRDTGTGRDQRPNQSLGKRKGMSCFLAVCQTSSHCFRVPLEPRPPKNCTLGNILKGKLRCLNFQSCLMGKAKKAPEAMARMSYLYQAANLIKKSGPKNNTSDLSAAKSAFARRVLSTNLGRAICTLWNSWKWPFTNK